MSHPCVVTIDSRSAPLERRTLPRMCMGCMGAAMGACAAASGARSWLAAKRCAWMTPARTRRTTAGLVAAALAASALLTSGSSRPSPPPVAPGQHDAPATARPAR